MTMIDDGQSERELLVAVCTRIEDAANDMREAVNDLTHEVRLASLRIATAVLMGQHTEHYVAEALRDLVRRVEDLDGDQR
jgi:hypothetical protein